MPDPPGFGDHDIRQTVNQCGISYLDESGSTHLRARHRSSIADGWMIMRALDFLACLFRIVSHPTATHSRFTWVITKQHYQFTVFDIRRAVITILPPAAISIVQTFRNYRRRVVTVMVKITAAAVHQARDQGISRRPGAGDDTCRIYRCRRLDR